jgi:alkylation response protein AidB-like acyl-CoA dehydrogenase
MDFAFTEEHEELRQAVRRFLENQSSEAAVRAAMETERGWDTRVWERMASEVALPGLAVPERHGGAGLGAVELAIVMEEMGRVLFCGPYLSTAVLAVGALKGVADEAQQAELLPEIAAGRTIATLATADENGRSAPRTSPVRAVRDGSVWRLEGVAHFVPDGHVADLILVPGRAGDGVGLFRVEGAAPRFERNLLPTLDLTRKLARLTFSGTPAVRISTGDAIPGLERVLALAIAALGAEQTGGAQRCLEMATEYARTRLQFGRPIGSFQAIKHKCADMLVEVEFARSAAYHAAFRAADGDDEELLTAAHMAKSYCSEAYFHAAAETIQIHGGMGFTWEHPAHLYFKRAKASAVLFGDPIDERKRLADRIGI